MGFVPFRRARLNQPVGDGIDWSNPLTRGLVFASVGLVTDLISRNSMLVLSGNYSTGVGSFGKCFIAPLSQSPGAATMSANLFLTGDYSFAVIAKPSTDNGVAETHEFVGSNTNFLSVAADGFSATIDNNSFAKISYVGTKPELYMATRIGNQVVGYIPNGVSNSSITGTRDQQITSVLVGRSGGRNNLTKTETYAVLVFNRSFGLREYMSFAANPWQLFQ